MKISGYIVFILYLLGAGTAVIVYEECEPRQEKTSKWIGYQTKITSWFPENMSPTDKEHITRWSLNITLHFLELETYKYYDIIKIDERGATVSRVRSGMRESNYTKFADPIDPGWTEFTLSDVSNIVLRYGSTEVVTLSADAVIAELIVSGSNVTIGCYESDFAWLVTPTEEAVIPLSNIDGEYILSFFSNDEWQPILKFSDTWDSVRFGLDGSSIRDITRFSAEHRRSLPVSIQLFVTITCKHAEDGVFCNILAGSENDNVKRFHAMEFPRSVSLTSGTDAPGYVFSHRRSRILSAEPTTFQPETPREEDSSLGEIIAMIILTLVCSVLISTGIVLFSRFRQKAQFVEDIHEIVQPLLDKRSDTSSITRKLSTDSLLLDPKMWEAVVKDDPRLVDYLIRQGVDPHSAETGKETTAYQEAHILGRKDILQVMLLYKEENLSTPADEFIKSILNVLEKRMEKVFVAAKLGMYARQRGVHQLLKAHSLPATIMDHQGRSLVHYLVSVSSIDGRPAWEAKDIHSFFEDHKCYVNASDFWGKSVLHSIAGRKRINQDTIIMWNDKEQTIEDAWLDMAKILLSYECDPRISDHQGIFPFEIARDNGHIELAELLGKESEKLGKIEYEAAVKNFPTLADCAKLGHTAKIQELLKSGVPFLPICSRSDPLVQAIRHNQREVVFLLLSAGSPLTNNSIEDLTPLDAAESTVGLPAFFPALMRKVYSDRYKVELERVPSSDDTYAYLRTGMKDYVKNIIDKGCDARWKFKQKARVDKSHEARQLLTQAAGLGLSLFCQLISMEDVHLHPLQNETKPFRKAHEKMQIDTQFALVRDLKMSPFTFTSATLESMPTSLREDMWVSQLKILESACQDSSDPYLTGDSRLQMLEYIQCIKDVSCSIENYTDRESLHNPPDLLLYLITKKGLDIILHFILIKCKTLNINKVVETFSKSTFLHVASMYGRLNMIEFLIYHGAHLEMTTIGGYTAAHLAALRGHEESMTYIEKHMLDKGLAYRIKCNKGFTAKELMVKYTDACRNSQLPIMSHRDALYVLNESGNADKAYEMLKRKTSNLAVETPEDLLECAKKYLVPQEQITNILNIVEEETKRLCEGLHDTEFRGRILPVGPLKEGYEGFGISNANFILELSKFHFVNDTSTIKYKVLDDKCSIKIESDTHSELFCGSTFIKRFSEAMKLAIEKYNPSTNVSFAPPFLKTVYKGVVIYINIHTENFTQLAIHLVPVIPAKFPLTTNDCSKDIFHLHINNAQGTWIYRPYLLETHAFTELDECEKEVWAVICFIRKLLDACIWTPRFYTKRYETSWHTLSVGVPHLKARVIRDLFLHELNEERDLVENEKIFNRLLSIYKRAVKKNDFGNWVPETSVSAYFIPEHSLQVGEGVCGIVKYLEELQGIYKSEMSLKYQQWQREALQE